MEQEDQNRTWVILLVEDDEDDYILTREMLAEARFGKFDLRWAESYDTGRQALLRGGYDAVLMDYDLGPHTGLELMREAAQNGFRAPTILITGRGSYEVDVEAMQAGASDYLTKSEINSPLLERTIRYAIERKQIEEALEQRVRERTAELQKANSLMRDEIKERRRIEKALRESEARFRSIYLETSMGIALVRKDGSILAINPACSEMLGHKESELRGHAIRDYIHREDLQALDTPFQQLLNGSLDHFRAEIRLFNKEEQLVWVRAVVSLVHTGNPQTGFAIGVLENVTGRKQMEEEVTELQRRLMESREAERLHLAQELHDGPMQALIGVSYQLKSLEMENLDKELSPHLVSLNENIIQTNQVLRMICGELRPPTLAPFGLEKAIRSHADQFQREHPEIEVHLDLDSDHKMLPEMVRLALFRIYQQALANIMRHSNASQVIVRFKLEVECVRLQVEDNGDGFVVPDRWIDFARQGHLGLAGAAERAEAAGGNMHIASAPGHGTLLEVVLPRVEQK